MHTEYIHCFQAPLEFNKCLIVCLSCVCVLCCLPAGKYVVFFFYPLDFTFVCPTEIIAFSDAAEEFRKIGCEVIGASIDSHFCHLAWYLRLFHFAILFCPLKMKP